MANFLRGKFDSEFMARALRYKWATEGDLEIISILEGFITFRFTNEKDLHRVRTKGPWVVGGTVLTMEEGRPNFKLTLEKITKATEWVRFLVSNGI